MTLDDLEHQNRGFCGFLADFGLQNTFLEEIMPQSVEISKNKLHTKFSALSVDFDCPNLDFLHSRKPVHESVKDRYHRKSHWPVFRESGYR